MSVFEENMIRYRQREMPAVGGVYGVQEARILGFTPQLNLIFVDDGVLIRDTTPSTNLYVAAPADWRILLEKLRLEISIPTIVIQAYLKFERAASTISGFYIPVIDLQSVGGHITSGTEQGIRIGFQLIRADLSLGATFGLDAITWDSGFWKVATQGTIYGDSSRFEPGGPFNALDTNTTVSFSLFDPEGECSVSISSSLAMNFFPVPFNQPRRGIAGVFSAPFTNGPYTGMHVFIEEPGGVSLRRKLDLTNFRTGKLEDKIYVIGTDLLS